MSVASIEQIVSCPFRVNKGVLKGPEALPEQQVAWRAQEGSKAVSLPREMRAKGIIREAEAPWYTLIQIQHRHPKGKSRVSSSPWSMRIPERTQKCLLHCHSR